MPLHIAPAEHVQIGEIVELAALTFPLACPPDLPTASVQAFIASQLSEEQFERYLRDSRYAVTVASDGEEVVGYALCVDGIAMDEVAAACVRGRPTRGISKFYLHPERHGSGGAGDLLDAIIAEAVQDGCRSLWLATNQQNQRALRFYRRRGFAIVGARTFQVGGVDNDDHVLELDLASPPHT